MRRFSWDAAIDARAKVLFFEGHTVDSIASAIGAGRNTVFKRIRQKGWKRMPEVRVALKNERWIKTPRDTAVAIERDRQMREALHKIGEAFRPRAASEGVVIARLRNFSCRWPLGLIDELSTHFCGAPVDVGVYCEVHHQLAYRKVERFEKAAEHELKRVATRGEANVKVER